VSEDLTQGTPEWHAARCGSLGASSIADALARIKTGWGASRAQVMSRLAIERLRGVPLDTYQNQAMLDGIAREPEARAAYQFDHMVVVKQVGIVRHPTIIGTHASPDGYVGNDGLLEIKCPTHATHFETLDGAPIPKKYIYQMQWQLCCTGRQWCDFASYHPDFPDNMKLHITRVARDDRMIADLEEQVREFLLELQTKLASLTARYGTPAREAA
jgi:putative phage-type endonuclease